VIRNDTILYEKYFNGYSREKQSQVFSVTKSVTSMLVGIAIAEGCIKSINQPVSDFLPYFKDGARDKLTLNHLLQMTAGMPSDYKSLGKLLNLYYTKSQERFIQRLKPKRAVGTEFAYSSAATQILGMCLEKATGRRFADYLEEKLWKPMGMEYDALVALDKPGGEAKMFGGLTASAVDLAKLARLYLHNGNWNGKQLIPESWVLAARQADTVDGRSSRYAYCWWLDTYPRRVGYYDNDFFAGGFRGQIVYGNPNDNTIIVRLGKREKGVFWPHAISKLSLIQECEKGSCKTLDLMALEGKYKSKNGKFFDLKKLDDVLVLEDINTAESGKIELLRDSNISFTNKDKDLKIIVDYRNQQVKGFFLEGPRGSQFFEKI
jgi:CubicO group peptidase (beta-lactamase class C family)